MADARKANHTLTVQPRKNLKEVDRKLVPLLKFEAMNHTASVGTYEGGARMFLFKLNNS